MHIRLATMTALALALGVGAASAQTRMEHSQTYQETTRNPDGTTTTTTRATEASRTGPMIVAPGAATAATSESRTTTITRASPPASIYGYELMTEKERKKFFDDLEDADNEAERQGVLAEHRVRMQQRAANMGVSLPEPETTSTTTVIRQE